MLPWKYFVFSLKWNVGWTLEVQVLFFSRILCYKRKSSIKSKGKGQIKLRNYRWVCFRTFSMSFFHQATGLNQLVRNSTDRWSQCGQWRLFTSPVPHTHSPQAFVFEQSYIFTAACVCMCMCVCVCVKSNWCVWQLAVTKITNLNAGFRAPLPYLKRHSDCQSRETRRS